MEREREVALVRRLRAGDLTAFDPVFDAFNQRLLSFLTRMAKNRSVAEDLLEETWLRLVSGGEDLHADTASVRGFSRWPATCTTATAAIEPESSLTQQILRSYGQASFPKTRSTWLP